MFGVRSFRVMLFTMPVLAIHMHLPSYRFKVETSTSPRMPSPSRQNTFCQPRSGDIPPPPSCHHQWMPETASQCTLHTLFDPSTLVHRRSYSQHKYPISLVAIRTKKWNEHERNGMKKPRKSKRKNIDFICNGIIYFPVA